MRQKMKQKMGLLDQSKLMSTLLAIVAAVVALGLTVVQLVGLQLNSTTPIPMDVAAVVAAQTAAAMPDPMLMVEIAGTQTAVAALLPTATLLPNGQYWVPPAADGFLPRFTYASTQWALVDASTLASLRVSGCTLRRAGGRALGPDWSTEPGSFTAGGVSFVTVLAKYQGTPQFITYSAPSGDVFEIASASGFEKCQQDGETVLKSLTLN